MILLTVFQCDKCQRLVFLKSNDDWRNFETNWHSGLLFHFCGGCVASRAVDLLLCEEREKEAALFTALKNIEKEKSDVAVIN